MGRQRQRKVRSPVNVEWTEVIQAKARMEARESVMMAMTASSESERLARGADREVAPVLW